MHYILDGKTPVPEPNLIKWARWFDNLSARKVAYTANKNKSVIVSTVFTGVDYQFARGKPLLFETLVFCKPYNHDIKRYSTWKGAVRGHKEIVRKLFRGQS